MTTTNRKKKKRKWKTERRKKKEKVATVVVDIISIDSEVRCKGAHPVCGALSHSGLLNHYYASITDVGRIARSIKRPKLTQALNAKIISFLAGYIRQHRPHHVHLFKDNKNDISETSICRSKMYAGRVVCCLRGTAAESRSFADKLSLSCARPVADG